MKSETVVTSKGMSTIPLEIRRRAGIGPGTVISWAVQGDGAIVVRKRACSAEQIQRHIRTHSGTWDGDISAAELLRRTRP